MATIEWALRRTVTTPARAATEDGFDWTTPPGMPRARFSERLAGALHRERERRTIDMASLVVARETGCR
jgi:hypothetical protein